MYYLVVDCLTPVDTLGRLAHPTRLNVACRVTTIRPRETINSLVEHISLQDGKDVDGVEC